MIEISTFRVSIIYSKYEIMPFPIFDVGMVRVNNAHVARYAFAFATEIIEND